MAWCPVGYVCIPEIYEACELAANRLLRGVTDYQSITGKTPFKVFHEAVGAEDDEAAIRRDEAYFSVHGAVFSEFLQEHRHDALACGPAGELFKISGFLLEPPLFNHWFQISRVHGRRPELRYIDVFTGLIDIKNSDKRIHYWWGDDYSLRWANEYVPIFSHLEGWSVCFAENKVDLSTDRLMKLWAPLNKTETNSETESQSHGIRTAYEEFMKVCPNGKDAAKMTWDEVEKATGWSRRQISRAIAIYGGQETGQVVGNS